MSSLGDLHIGGARCPEEGNKDGEETEKYTPGETDRETRVKLQKTRARGTTTGCVDRKSVS